MLAAETLFKRISLLVSKQKWLMQLNFYHSIAILTDLHLIQGVFERFCNLGVVHKRRHQFYLTFWSPPFLKLYINNLPFGLYPSTPPLKRWRFHLWPAPYARIMSLVMQQELSWSYKSNLLQNERLYGFPLYGQSQSK